MAESAAMCTESRQPVDVGTNPATDCHITLPTSNSVVGSCASPPPAIDVSLAASPETMTPAAGTPTRRDFASAAAAAAAGLDSCERLHRLPAALRTAERVLAVREQSAPPHYPDGLDGTDYYDGDDDDDDDDVDVINVTAPRSLRVRFADADPSFGDGRHHHKSTQHHLLGSDAGVAFVPGLVSYVRCCGEEEDDCERRKYSGQPPRADDISSTLSACGGVSNGSLLSMPGRSPGSSGVSADDFGGGLRRIVARATTADMDSDGGVFAQRPLTLQFHHHGHHMSALSPAYSPPVSVPATPAPATPCGVFRDEASASSFSRSAEHMLVSCIAGSSPTTSRTPGRRVRFGCVRVFAIPPREPRNVAPPFAAAAAAEEETGAPLSRSSSGSSAVLLSSTSSPAVVAATTATTSILLGGEMTETDTTPGSADASPLVSPLAGAATVAASVMRHLGVSDGVQLHSPTTPPPTPSAPSLSVPNTFPGRRPRRSLSDYASENRGSIDSELRAAEAAATSRMSQARCQPRPTGPLLAANGSDHVLMIPPPPPGVEFQNLPPPVAQSFDQSL